MCDRDRLIELFKKTEYTPFPEMTMKSNLGNQFTEYALNCIVDELLANGVIVPPCKVGDKTFLLLEKTSGGYDIVESKCVKIYENAFNRVYSMALACAEIGNTLEFYLNDFGRWVFLTKEEAEERLKKINEMSHIQK